MKILYSQVTYPNSKREKVRFENKAGSEAAYALN